MIGVTGTQGKTTTTRLAEGGLEGSGTRAGVVGTVGTRIAGQDVPTTLTTPEAPDLHGLFALMRERDVAACAMEVSSHALVMGRVDGVVFDVAVFLNLGRDHLDFHGDRGGLLSPPRPRCSPPSAPAWRLVNVDDEHGRRLARRDHGAACAPSPRAVPTPTGAPSTSTCGPTGSTFTVLGPDGLRVAAGVPLPGDFNVANALAAIAACAEAGLRPGPGRRRHRRRRRGPRPLRAGRGRPGLHGGRRLRPQARRGRGRLATLRPLTRGPGCIVVLGAGGDRDPGKRPIMGEIAAAARRRARA